MSFITNRQTARNKPRDDGLIFADRNARKLAKSQRDKRAIKKPYLNIRQDNNLKAEFPLIL